jgi:hypothetical protein
MERLELMTLGMPCRYVAMWRVDVRLERERLFEECHPGVLWSSGVSNTRFVEDVSQRGFEAVTDRAKGKTTSRWGIREKLGALRFGCLRRGVKANSAGKDADAKIAKHVNEVLKTLKTDVKDENNFEEVDLTGMRYLLELKFPRSRFELIDDRKEAAKEQTANFEQSTPTHSVVDMDLKSVEVSANLRPMTDFR